MKTKSKLQPKNVFLRLSDENKKRLKEMADASGLSITAYAEAAILEALEEGAQYEKRYKRATIRSSKLPEKALEAER